ncbi:MAG: TlpA disulfide reductase family protein [Desulfovibrionaceae bacterium]
MKRRMHRVIRWTVLFALVLAAAPASASAGAPPQAGETLPDMTFPAPPDPADARELGVAGESTFTLAGLDRKVVLIEVVGVYCAQCATQAPLFNNLHNRLKRRGLLGQAAMIALAAGATPQEAAYLRSEGRYGYPVVTDQDYTLHKLLGEPETPYTMLVNAQGEVLFAKLGVERDVEDLYQRIKEALEADGS